MNVYLINVQGLTLNKKIEIERIISENGECVNIVAVVETQMKYRKMDWSKGIEMVDKIRKEQDKKGERLLIAAGGDRCIFDKLSNVSEDLLIVRVKTVGFEVVIFVIYLDVKDRERNRKIDEDVERNLEKHEDKNILFIGDFNGHLGFIGTQQINFNGQLIMKLMEGLNLTLLHGVERQIWKKYPHLHE